MNARTVRIGLVQTAVSEDLEKNLEKTLRYAASALEQGAEILCLPELYRTPYFPQSASADAARYAESIPGESTEAFAALAREHHAVIVVPLYERAGEGGYNAVAVVDTDGCILPVYRKVHVPCDPLFYEKRYFRAGERYEVYSTEFGRFAVLICYDQWFPEAARAVTLMGADIIFYPTAIGRIRGLEPPEGDWREAWETVQRGHAIANGIHVAAVNRVGREGEILFWGSSFVCDAFGKVLARGGTEEGILIADLDLGMNRQVREGWGFLENRCPATYLPLVPAGGAVPVRDRAGTPRKQGYRMPAEWERHDAVWLAWPHDSTTFPDLGEVERAYAAIVKAVSTGERVELLVGDPAMEERVRGLLGGAGVPLDRIRFHVLGYADVWFRDYGPTFVVNREGGRLAMVDWIFNAWGEKYPELMRDTHVPAKINRELRLMAFRPDIVLEGGSIEVNGRGTVLTTEQCLLNPNRNPSLSRGEIEGYLQEYLGVSRIVWLKEGIAGDDTDGHIDDIARFVGPNTVVCAREEDAGDANHAILEENHAILRRARDQDNNPFTVVPLPMPGRVGDEERLPASYANFYIGNTVVLVPTFGHRNDRRALEILQGVFPSRKVVGIDGRAMVRGLGTLHCITQQQPSRQSPAPHRFC